MSPAHFTKTVALALLLQTVFLVSDARAENLRCVAARHLCDDGDQDCQKYVKMLDNDGLVCPGLIGLLPAFEPNRERPSSVAQQPELPTQMASDDLRKIQNECAAADSDKPFRNEIMCIENGTRSASYFSATEVASDLQLYTLIARRLVEDIDRKRLTKLGAQAELQKALVNFRDQMNRRTTEVTMQANTTRLEQSQAEQAAKTAQAFEAQQREAILVAESQDAREQQRRHQEALNFCISEANVRLSENPRFVNDHIYLGLFPMTLESRTFRNVDRFCASDQYWYKQIPRPQKFINCQNQGAFGVSCTQN